MSLLIGKREVLKFVTVLLSIFYLLKRETFLKCEFEIICGFSYPCQLISWLRVIFVAPHSFFFYCSGMTCAVFSYFLLLQE